MPRFVQMEIDCECDEFNEQCQACQLMDGELTLLCQVCRLAVDMMPCLPLCKSCLEKVNSLEQQGFSIKRQCAGKAELIEAVVDAKSGTQWTPFDFDDEFDVDDCE